MRRAKLLGFEVGQKEAFRCWGREGRWGEGVKS